MTIYRVQYRTFSPVYDIHQLYFAKNYYDNNERAAIKDMKNGAEECAKKLRLANAQDVTVERFDENIETLIHFAYGEGRTIQKMVDNYDNKR